LIVNVKNFKQIIQNIPKKNIMSERNSVGRCDRHLSRSELLLIYLIMEDKLIQYVISSEGTRRVNLRKSFEEG
jgi:hypothetical protein